MTKPNHYTSEEATAILERLAEGDDDSAEAGGTDDQPETAAQTVVRLEGEANKLRASLQSGFSADTLQRLETIGSELTDLKERLAREEAVKEKFWRDRMSKTFITRAEFDREWGTRWRHEALREEMSADDRLHRAARHPLYRDGF